MVASCIMRLGWGNLVAADRPLAALMWATMAELLGATIGPRCPDGIRHSSRGGRRSTSLPLSSGGGGC